MAQIEAPTTPSAGRSMPSIWWFAFGYFACYIPYTALAKSISKGALPGMTSGIPGASLLPATTLVCGVIMIGFLGITGWWRYATRHSIAGLKIPGPTRWTFLSGLCTAVILTTTTLAYTFEGVSIVLVMLLMRGGVLSLAPVVDLVTGRKPTARAMQGLILCFAALIVAFLEKRGFDISTACTINIALYLGAYFMRLIFMSRMAKSADPAVTKRYFAEEQLVAIPVTLVVLTATAFLMDGPFPQVLHAGFVDVPSHDFFGLVLLIGVFSQGVGICGTLIFLDRSDNTVAVPVNRASSILAGVASSLLLAATLDLGVPSAYQFGGAALVICAVIVLSRARTAKA